MNRYSNLYFHFPYCETKCHYCDFYSLPESKYSPTQRTLVYNAILKELEMNLDLIGDVKTVFMGGGTPSLVPMDVLKRALQLLKLTPDAEVTMEANPSSITREKACEWKRIGVNRISVGAQAFDNDRLKWLSRIHDVKEVYTALDALKAAGILRVTIDYMVGVPGQSAAVIDKEISEVLLRYPDIKHVSAYLLTLNHSNPKFKDLPDADEGLWHLNAIRDVLMANGFEQYEISNFSVPGFEARHNENYWLQGGYLGIGPSAHSFDPSEKGRFKNWANVHRYVEEIERGQKPVEWTETLTPEQERIECIMLSLRRKAGLDLQVYSTRFGQDILASRGPLIDRLIKQNLCVLDIENHRLRLTSNGFFLSDSIFSKLV